MARQDEHEQPHWEEERSEEVDERRIVRSKRPRSSLNELNQHCAKAELSKVRDIHPLLVFYIPSIRPSKL